MKLISDKLLSNFAFKVKLRPSNLGEEGGEHGQQQQVIDVMRKAGCCGLTPG